MENLLKQIEGMIVEKSLSLDVIEIVRKIQSEHASLTEQNKFLEKTIEFKGKEILSLQEANTTAQNTIVSLTTKVTGYEQREDEFKKSEHTIALKNKDVDSSNRAIFEIKEVVGMVFKNTNIRKTVTGTDYVGVPGANGCNGYMQNMPKNDTEIVTED